RAAAGPARLTALLLASSVVWIPYLGCLAYVENGVLFFAAVAGGLLLRDGAGGCWRAAFLAGICAGLAGGCKYTALALVGVALGASWFLSNPAAWFVRCRPALTYTLGVLLAFSPWLIRNAAFTGNPTY